MMNIQELSQEKLLLSKLLEQQQYIATLLSKLVERNGTIEELYHAAEEMNQDLKAAQVEIASLKADVARLTDPLTPKPQ